ncbi:MAG TPA: hypothetical protein VJQ59_15850 [Candidatus Sulfotelmatobacter sp.]|nr:hypothetical protein [Candidatus Sulfotelmatobacter sp.]
MYEVDDQDRVVPLDELPQSSVGSPIPQVLAMEADVVLAYYVQEREFWTKPRPVNPETFDELVALVRFHGCIAHLWGPPNDEALTGHPLASRGLQPYGIFRIENSSWIRKLERMNRVHRSHKPERYWQRQHLIFTFHDSTFECVCNTFEATTKRGPIAGMIPEMQKLLEKR